jgi:hypothetical protein
MQTVLEELFLSTEIYGLLGPLALVILGLVLSQKDKGLSIIFIIVDSVVIWQYLNMDNYELYLWHSIILLLGVIMCMLRMATKR